MILKLAKAGAGAIKIQCAILSRSGTCQLDMSPASGFDYPHFQIEPREPTNSARELQHKNFFADRLRSRVKCPRVKCPTLISNCLADATTGGGVRVCIARVYLAFWLGLCNRTIATNGTQLWAQSGAHRTGKFFKTSQEFGAQTTI